MARKKSCPEAQYLSSRCFDVACLPSSDRARHGRDRDLERLVEQEGSSRKEQDSSTFDVNSTASSSYGILDGFFTGGGYDSSWLY